jgi:thiol-disulfide isomerase/thioredoxin|tara:strand:- start:7450 stop:7959 length:510 start_codon:yes stop_codon:yes gene_type:complete
MKLLYVNGQNAKYFDSENKKKHVFAKYFSPTCPACISMENDWDKMCDEVEQKYNTDLMVAQIDPQGMNELEKLDTYSDVQYVPALIILKNGKKVDEYTGPKEKDKLIEFLMNRGLIKPKHIGGRSKKGRKGKYGKKSKTSKTSKKNRKIVSSKRRSLIRKKKRSNKKRK